MPATGWSSIATGELEVSMFAEAAVTGGHRRGDDHDLLARARVVNASRLYVFVEIEIDLI